MPDSICSYENCGRTVYKGGDTCIFHAAEKDPQEFKDAAEAQINAWQRHDLEEWNFRGWCFPLVPFQTSAFNRRLDFTGARFNKRACFIGFEFRNEVTFSNVEFESVTFDKAKFKDIATFTEAQFNKAADFGKAIFESDVGFESAIFKARPYFGGSIFIGEADFTGATFSKSTCFLDVTFMSKSDFSEIEIHGELDLTNVSFAAIGDFSGSHIQGYSRLLWPGKGYKYSKNGNIIPRGKLLLENLQFESDSKGEESILDLRNNYLQEDCELIIADTRMNRILMTGTDIRRVELRNTSPYVPRGHKPFRRMIGDEIFLRKDRSIFGDSVPSWDSIAVAYQQLTDKFRKNLNHPIANDFERGIFECRLMAAWQRDEKGKRDWKNVLLLWLYKGASNFGGSIWRPAWLTGAFLLLFSVLYGIFIFDGCFGWPHDWKVVGNSMLASLRVAVLDRHWFTIQVETIQDVGWKVLVSFAALLQTAVTAALVTLFIFAIRRRFKHTE
jgi:uncharacterized protein YjbI with pentapeptide repeats